MKKRSTSSLQSPFSGMVTPVLAAMALLATFYVYGEVQSWSFLNLSSSPTALRWQKDFVDHLDKCEEAPSTLAVCTQAVLRARVWLEAETKEKLPATDFLQSIGSVKALKAAAIALEDIMPRRLESEVTLVALNLWLRQLDPFARLYLDEPRQKSESSWSLERLNEKEAVLRIKHFHSETLCRELKPVLAALEAEDSFKFLKLDVRGNPGGQVEAALCVGSLFVPEGETLARFEKSGSALPFVVEERNSFAEWARERLGVRRIIRKSQGDMVFSKSLEIWIDRRSASAAELLAASLKDLGRARLVGEKSFGKNSVQLSKKIKEIEPLKAVLTTYRWYRLSGESVEATRGLVPDIIL